MRKILALTIILTIGAITPSYALDEKQFWKIIDTIAPTSFLGNETHKRALTGALSDLSRKELIEFGSLYEVQLNKAYHWDVWAACYIINGGCSDDGFRYFRSWLISKGEAVFKSTLKNPETLIPVISKEGREYYEFEAFNYVARKVYRVKFGGEIPIDVDHPKKVAGQNWKESELPAKYPALMKWVHDKWEKQKKNIK